MLKGILSKLDPDLVIQEAMYGFIMALTLVTAVQVGLISYDGPWNLILAIVGMDFVWGTIDMYIFYRGDRMSRARRLNRYGRVISEKDHDKQVELMCEEFDGTLFELASKSDRRKMAEIFLDSGFISYAGILHQNRNYLFNAVTAFAVTLFTVIPSIICLSVIDDFPTAALATSLASSVALFFIGYLESPSNRLRGKILTGATTAGISLLFTVFAAYLGG